MTNSNNRIYTMLSIIFFNESVIESLKFGMKEIKYDYKE